MKLSELIKHLENLQRENGDVEVYTCEDTMCNELVPPSPRYVVDMVIV